FLTADRSRVERCAGLIRVVDVNRRTLELFEADDLIHLVANLDKVFQGDMFTTHIEELAQLWHGRGSFKSQTVNYTLSG
ncbi:histidine kinase, partial [Mycobacterium tuberculosis]|nr:histidine kinase [Mycobacterium tuberculosis]